MSTGEPLLDEHSAHPLFLPEQADDQFVFPHSISVIRCDRHWRQVDTSAELVSANELRSPADIVNRYGGGFYELYGRDKRGRVQARRRIGPLPGKPKPMCAAMDFGIEEDDEVSPPVAVAPAASSSSSTDFLQVVTMLQQGQREQREFMAAMLQESKAAAREAIERTEKFADRMMNVMATTMQAKIEAPVAQMQAAQPNQLEALLKGVQLATDLQAAYAQPGGEGGTGDIADTIKLFVEGMGALDKLQGSQAGAPLPPPTPPRDMNGGSS